jgi:hypothetical protein
LADSWTRISIDEVGWTEICLKKIQLAHITQIVPFGTEWWEE